LERERVLGEWALAVDGREIDKREVGDGEIGEGRE
jgi:hypothetical protein